jgi:hypothetical protein
VAQRAAWAILPGFRHSGRLARSSGVPYYQAMTTRRRLLLFGLLAGSLALGTGAWLFWPRPGITRENAAKIQVGMTLAEVEAILGGPSRDESTEVVTERAAADDDDSAVFRVLDFTYPRRPASSPEPPVWKTDQIVIVVHTSHDGRVVSSASMLVRPIGLEETWSDRLCRWLGLPPIAGLRRERPQQLPRASSSRGSRP